mgnify:CR=1 FL=1
MKALSLQQPYADLIIERAHEDNPYLPLKAIENRSWPLPATFTVPQRIYVHASMSFYPVTLGELRNGMTVSQWLRLRNRLHTIFMLWESYKADGDFRRKMGYFGCLIGEVTITGQVTRSDNPWFFGPYGFTLAEPVRYDKAIPCRGSLGFFEPNITQEVIGCKKD